MKTYQEILDFVRYKTMNHLLELENFKINDLVMGGIHYILKHLKFEYQYLVTGDSEKRTLLSPYDNELMIEIKVVFEHTPEIVDYVDLGDFVRIKLLTQEISVFSTKVVYLEINKKLLK